MVPVKAKVVSVFLTGIVCVRVGKRYILLPPFNATLFRHVTITEYCLINIPKSHLIQAVRVQPKWATIKKYYAR